MVFRRFPPASTFPGQRTKACSAPSTRYPRSVSMSTRPPMPSSARSTAAGSRRAKRCGSRRWSTIFPTRTPPPRIARSRSASRRRSCRARGAKTINSFTSPFAATTSRAASGRAPTVMLIDTSGSMQPSDRLPVLQQGFRLFRATAARRRSRGHRNLRGQRADRARADLRARQAQDSRCHRQSARRRLHGRRRGACNAPTHWPSAISTSRR